MNLEIPKYKDNKLSNNDFQKFTGYIDRFSHHILKYKHLHTYILSRLRDTKYIFEYFKNILLDTENYKKGISNSISTFENKYGYVENETITIRKTMNNIFNNYNNSLKDVNILIQNIEKNLLQPCITKLKELSNSLESLFNSLESKYKSYNLYTHNFISLCYEYETSFVEYRKLKIDILSIYTKIQDSENIDHIQSMKIQLEQMSNTYFQKKYEVQSKLKLINDNLIKYNESLLSLKQGYNDFISYLIETDFQLNELTIYCFKSYNEILATNKSYIKTLYYIEPEELSKLMTEYNFEVDIENFMASLNIDEVQSKDADKFGYFQDKSMEEIEEKYLLEILNSNILQKIYPDIKLEIEFNEIQIFNQDKIFSDLVKEIIHTKEGNNMVKLQEMEKMCNVHENVQSLIKIVTNSYGINVYSLTISPIQIQLNNEQYFVVSHIIVTCCNYIYRAIKSYGIKKKYIEVLYEVLIFSCVFWKAKDYNRIRLVSSLHSELFFNMDVWEVLLDYEIDLLINFHEQKKKKQKAQVDLMSGNIFKNMMTMIEDNLQAKKSNYVNVIITRLSHWLSFMVEIEVGSDIVNHVAQKECRKRKLDYDKTLNLLSEVHTYEKALAVEKSRPMFKWETPHGMTRLFIEKMINYGFTMSKTELDLKLGVDWFKLQTERESYKHMIRNASSVEGKCKIIEEIVKKFLSTEKGLFQKLLDFCQSVNSRRAESKYKFLEVIDMDVDRTYNGAKYFAERSKESMGVLQVKLRRVLQAYAIKNQKVGYCQGMNYLASFCLVLKREKEEEAFLLFDAIINHMKIEPLYDNSMEYLKTQFYLTDRLISIYLNKLYRHVYSQGGGVKAALWISPWVVTLYCNLLHSATCTFDTALAVFENVLIDKWIGINKNLLLICRDICSLHAEYASNDPESHEMLVQRFFDYRNSRVFVSREYYNMMYDAVDIDVYIMKNLEEEYKEVKVKADLIKNKN